MKYILILFLLLYSSFASAGIIYVRFVDTTGDEYELIDVYQNDAMSHRYIKTINMSCEDMPVIGTATNYTLVIHPSRSAILKDVGNSKQLSYLYHEAPLWVFNVLIVVLLILFYTQRNKIMRG